MMDTETFRISVEPTPNPQAMRFTWGGGDRVPKTVEFRSAQEARFTSPLAAKLFGFPWCASVLVAPGSVTINKQDWVDWDVIAEPLASLIEEHLNRGEAILSESSQSKETSAAAANSQDPIVQAIERVIDQEIRPMVAMDGGDIVFRSFESGVVYLSMHGSCAGCPSSTATLKQGIEVRLQAAIPEVREVVAVS